jgi:hypothetical protein
MVYSVSYTSCLPEYKDIEKIVSGGGENRDYAFISKKEYLQKGLMNKTALPDGQSGFV